jgi:hypothetical protein
MMDSNKSVTAKFALCCKGSDINGDGKIGLAEAIHALKILATGTE